MELPTQGYHVFTDPYLRYMKVRDDLRQTCITITTFRSRNGARSNLDGLSRMPLCLSDRPPDSQSLVGVLIRISFGAVLKVSERPDGLDTALHKNITFF